MLTITYGVIQCNKQCYPIEKYSVLLKQPQKYFCYTNYKKKYGNSNHLNNGPMNSTSFVHCKISYKGYEH